MLLKSQYNRALPFPDVKTEAAAAGECAGGLGTGVWGSRRTVERDLYRLDFRIDWCSRVRVVVVWIVVVCEWKLGVSGICLAMVYCENELE